MDIGRKKFGYYDDTIDYYFPKSRRVRGREYVLISKGYNTKELMKMMNSSDEETQNLALGILKQESLFLYKYFYRRINTKTFTFKESN